MARFNFLVFSDGVPVKEDEYHRWYNEQHLPDVLRVPGFVAAQRFRLAQEDAAAPARHVAIYEIDTDDLQRTMGELQSRAGTAAMPMSDAMDVNNVKTFLYTPITARKTT